MTLGFNLAVGSLAAVAVAVALDLLYWLGPRVTLGQAWLGLMMPQLEGLPVEPAMLDGLRENVQTVAQVNLLQSLSGALSLGGVWPLSLPSLLASDPTLPGLGPTWELPSLSLALALFPLLLALGCLLGSVYLTLVAARVRGEPTAGADLARWMLGTWGRVFALNLVVLLLIMVGSVPLTLIVIVANLIQPLLGSFVLALATIVLALVWIHGLFTLPVIVLERVNPLRAYWLSLRFVRRHFWAALGLMGLAFVLNLGLGEVWRWLAETGLGTPIGMLGHAFVGTALTAAILAFYHDQQATAKS
ncbi:MAG: hypothetical protein KIT87_25050 [Anaerolineae bacterium]|nr:hypothetical protein [Anaerolineae bacterium]